MNDTTNDNNNSLRMFFILAVVLIGFTLTIVLFGYLWALLFAAVVAVYVLWQSRTPKRQSPPE